jgi:hypothetical protein
MSVRNAELQRLLASLNGSSAVNLGSTGFQLPGLGALPPEQNSALKIHPQPDGHANEQAASINQNRTPSTQEYVRPRQATPLKVVPDASTITTWPAAIKHVTKHLTNDENVTSRIRHLINEQRKHEEQWWKQRQEIVVRHQNRSGNQNKVADILKELGGLAVPVAQVDEAADKNELETFDRKVYKSMVQMAANCDVQLRKLGVPFFAIKHELVIIEGSKEQGQPAKGKLDKGELRELQKRMLQHLEDLLSDD